MSCCFRSIELLLECLRRESLIGLSFLTFTEVLLSGDADLTISGGQIAEDAIKQVAILDELVVEYLLSKEDLHCTSVSCLAEPENFLCVTFTKHGVKA